MFFDCTYAPISKNNTALTHGIIHHSRFLSFFDVEYSGIGREKVIRNAAYATRQVADSPFSDLWNLMKEVGKILRVNHP
jgi:hypothetical protein